MDLRAAQWRKSTWSGGDGGECVEVAGNLVGVVAVRDSKNASGPVLTCSPSEWAAFIGAAKRGRFGV